LSCRSAPHPWSLFAWCTDLAVLQRLSQCIQMCSCQMPQITFMSSFAICVNIRLPSMHRRRLQSCRMKCTGMKRNG
jgi:hypothetical protein